MGSVVAAPGLSSKSSIAMSHGLSCPEACGIFSDQVSNLCPRTRYRTLCWQADSYPLDLQGSCWGQLLKEWNDNSQNGRRYLQIIYLIRDSYLDYTKNFDNSTVKRQNCIKKWTEDLKEKKNYIQVANKHMQSCFPSFTSRKMLIKAVHLSRWLKF